MAKRNTIMKTIILFKNNNLATMLYAAKLKINAIELRLAYLSCGYSLVRQNIKRDEFMKHIFLIIFIFNFNFGYGQVDNYDLLTKNIESTNIKSITKYRESKKFPNGEKIFKLEFNKQGKLMTIEEFDYQMGPDNPITMRQEIKYNETGNKVAIYAKAPDGSTAIDTLIYNDKGEYIQKQRIVNGKIVKTWDYTNKRKVDAIKEFDVKGNLVKLIESEGNYTTFKYDSTGNLIQELQFQDGKEHTKNIFQYNKNSRLIKMNTYLLYIGEGTNEPLTYYFEYEIYE